ncbi:MAG: hypothetical protein KGM15_02890 [Pseudomonadota bacterium]|nr:hypothetical protein [Pseudomonadota bacterium]
MLTLSKRKDFLTLGIILQLGAYVPAASAQMAVPEKWFSAPVPETLLAPFEQFLSRLGVKDARTIISKTGFGYIGNSHSIGFRIEDDGTCYADRDKCLTIIGHVVEQRFSAETMFFAGAKVSRMDTMKQLLGVGTFPYIVYRANGNADVVLYDTPEGWVIVPTK